MLQQYVLLYAVLTVGLLGADGASECFKVNVLERVTLKIGPPGELHCTTVTPVGAVLVGGVSVQ